MASDSDLDLQLRRLANLRRTLTEADEIARSLLIAEPFSHDWQLLVNNVAGTVLQVMAFERKLAAPPAPEVKK